ncbi:unnamed protein product [Agarophyton chilense]
MTAVHNLIFSDEYFWNRKRNENLLKLRVPAAPSTVRSAQKQRTKLAQLHRLALTPLRLAPLCRAALRLSSTPPKSRIMTTAHRATWKAARGGLQEEGSFRLHAPSVAVSGKDAPTERTLKKRHFTPADASRDEMRLRIDNEEEHVSKRPRRSRFGPTPEADAGGEAGQRLLLAPSDAAETQGSAAKEKHSNSPDEDENGVAAVRNDVQSGAAVDATEADGADEGKHFDQSQQDSDSEDDESEEDEAELLAELERIRKEREFDKAKKQAEEQERLEREETTKAASENPLLAQLSNFNDEISETASIATGSVPAFAVRRRWDDDVVFRNQARGERSHRPRFLNDTIRNDFHKRFMKQYMRL